MRLRSVASIAGAAVIAVTGSVVGLVATGGVSQAAKAPADYYLSLGDSYSVGYQPPNGTFPGGSTAGYTAVIAKKEKLQLENFGCGGATTTSLLTNQTCDASAQAATDDATVAGETQIVAAEDFIAANPGKVKLITISISGNDVTACASASDPVSCVEAAQAAISTNVTTAVDDLSGALTSAGDTSAHIVGLTYPDVLIGSEVYPTVSGSTTLADESVLAFDDLINPTLKSVYTSVPGGMFVNVTSAPYKKATAGDDTPSTTLVKLAPYGKIPANLWEVCVLSWYCSLGNIHATTTGYDFIGSLVVDALRAA